jgi:spore germination protein KB
MMLDKGKISALQMAFLLYPTILATGFLVVPTASSKHAQNDLWMSSLLSFFLGFVAIAAADRLHRLFPKQTIIQYSERIIGKAGGSIIGLVYVFVSFHACGSIVRQYAEFVKVNFMFKTPTLLIIGTMILLAAFAVRGGVELVARSALLLTPIFMLPIVFLLLAIPDMEISNIFPILSHGIVPVLKGTLLPQSWASQFFLMSFFLPCLTDPEKAKKWSLLTLGAVVISMTYVNLTALFVLGPDTADKIYPVLDVFRLISIAEFFENLEALLMAMWIVGNFVKISFFYYTAVVSLGQWLKLEDTRPFVFPIGIVIVAFSLWDLPGFIELGNFLTTVSPFYLPTVYILIPMFLLAAALLRKRSTAA